MRTIPTLTSPTPVTNVSAPAPVPPVVSRHPAAVIMDDPTTAGVLYSAWSGDPAVVVPSPPGAGKTRLVSLLAATLATRADLRVGIAAQTRDQAVEIARRVGVLDCAASLIWSAKGTRPDLRGGRVAVVTGRGVRYPNSGGGVLIATTARWMYADPSRVSCDVMIVDEAWQATYADLGALGAFAPRLSVSGTPARSTPWSPGKPTGGRTHPPARTCPPPRRSPPPTVTRSRWSRCGTRGGSAPPRRP